MEVSYIGKELTPEIREQLWEILLACDQDFCPPLSSRAGSCQKELNGLEVRDEEGPREYFEEMCKQHFIVAREEGRIIAFLTFREPYICPELEAYGQSLYMTTMCIIHSMRGKGIAGRLYEVVENGLAKEMGYSYITLRTWSTNAAQMHLLPKRGYRTVAVKKDDRGPGVDTVYFVREA